MFFSVALGIILGAFLLDVTLHMGRVERGIVLVFFVFMSGWTFRRFVMPAMSVREDETELALMVERKQGIGSELVAALQFADADRTQYGSSDLRGAVIDITDEVASSLNYLDGFSRQELTRRFLTLCIIVALTAIPWVFFPRHAVAFANRFLLGSAHYPTRTVIESIELPKKRTAYGQPVVFKITASGELPESGRVEVRAVTSGLRTTIELKPNEQDNSIFQGELPRALDDIAYQIYLGDAYTEEREVSLIPLPVVEVGLQVQIPDYARGIFPVSAEGRQRVVLEGSRVIPTVTSDKPLLAARIVVDGNTYPMRKESDTRYTLDAPDTPMARAVKDMRFEIQVKDADGLGLDRPISGVVQVRADQPPRIAAATVTRFVLANAAPKIKFKAVDDYALGKIQLRKAIVRAPTEGEPAPSTESAGGAAGAVVAAQEIVTTVREIKGGIRELADTIAVELTDLKLNIGDRVEITVEAIDFRGPPPAVGKATRSERIVFQVTDRKGVLDAMRELDPQMDKKLDQIIDAHLGGGSQ